MPFSIRRMLIGLSVALTTIALVLSMSPAAQASSPSSRAVSTVSPMAAPSAGSTPDPTPVVTDGPKLAAIRAIVDAQPASAELTSAQRAHLASVLYGVGTALAEGQPVRAGQQPSWSVGLGWWIYIHHITPADQRWFLQVGIGVVATTLCAVSGTTLCAVAGVAAVVLVTSISEYFNPTWCLEAELTYSGRLHRIYYARC